MNPQTYYTRLARMCGVWAAARQLYKQGAPLDCALWLLQPALKIARREE